MSLHLPYLTPTCPFPPVERALTSPNGLLAYGADLSPTRLFTAYYEGIFPWFSEGEPLLWWSPCPRAVLYLDDFRVSKSMRKWLHGSSYRITLNRAFGEVIGSCAQIPRYQGMHATQGTWITHEMRAAYQQLHELGLAHSIEVWRDTHLVGGLYGVAVGKVFCGESMFHSEANTSKLAMLALVTHMRKHQQSFIDCQMPTAHLTSLGSTTVSRAVFIEQLQRSRHTFVEPGKRCSDYIHTWTAQEIVI